MRIFLEIIPFLEVVTRLPVDVGPVEVGVPGCNCNLQGPRKNRCYGCLVPIEFEILKKPVL